MIYSLWVDDITTGRADARDALDMALAGPKPTDPEMKLASNDPDWGLTPDAIAAQGEIDAYFPESI